MALSVGIIALNEAEKIGRTLAAVRGWAEQIVVVDSGSTDGTQDICRQYGAEVIHQEWLGYGAQKNVVIDHCREDWILALDADEVVTPELRRAIDDVLANPQYAVYLVRFRHILLGREIRHGGWERQFRRRLFRRDAGHWNDDPVHETFVTAYPVSEIDAPLEHYTSTKLEEFRRKQQRYVLLEAQAAYRNGERPRRAYALLYSGFHFLIIYFRKLGFLDGRVGLQLAIFRALYFFQKDRRLAELYAGQIKLEG